MFMHKYMKVSSFNSYSFYVDLKVQIQNAVMLHKIAFSLCEMNYFLVSFFFYFSYIGNFRIKHSKYKSIKKIVNSNSYFNGILIS